MNAEPSPDLTAAASTALRRNIELKARLTDLDRARRRAQEVATATLPSEHQVDTYFSAKSGRLKLREINGLSAVLISYQRADHHDSRKSSYRLVPVAEGALLKAALSSALGVIAIVEKSREIFLFRNVRIHLDQVVGRGNFLEFEAVLAPDDEDKAGHDLLRWLQRHFEIADQDLISGSYGDA
jgi:adenylate cyclase class IV